MATAATTTPRHDAAANGTRPSVAVNDQGQVSLEGYDPEQIALMEERLIVVDNDDKPIGEGSKKECHLMVNINPPKSLLHRAFSCFLFRPSDGRLLLQKRASEKITFPDLWTNTCCSHPLAISAEMDPTHQIGVRRAAQRKLKHELGIEASQVPLEDFIYLTRIHYLAPSDGIWGEHEVDYILFITAEVDVHVNTNECCEVAWVSKHELEAMMLNPAYAFTPWFKLIVGKFLYPWWSRLIQAATEGQESEEGKEVNQGRYDARVLADIGREEGDRIHRML